MTSTELQEKEFQFNDLPDGIQHYVAYSISQTAGKGKVFMMRILTLTNPKICLVFEDGKPRRFHVTKESSDAFLVALNNFKK